MEKILVSACLLGVKCKYNGGDNLCPQLLKEDLCSFVPVCPEQLSGLPTPRAPMELREGRVINTLGEDLTEKMEKGAEETLRIARLFGCTKALLKARSPSCGFGEIYDGSFSGKRVPGMGTAAKKLHEAGITILTEEEWLQT